MHRDNEASVAAVLCLSLNSPKTHPQSTKYTLHSPPEHSQMHTNTLYHQWKMCWKQSHLRETPKHQVLKAFCQNSALASHSLGFHGRPIMFGNNLQVLPRCLAVTFHLTQVLRNFVIVNLHSSSVNQRRNVSGNVHCYLYTMYTVCTRACFGLF